VGWGWQSIAFVCWGRCIIFCYQVCSSLSHCFFTLTANDRLDEKEAEKRATCYRPKTPLKRGWKLPFCRYSAFFYASLLAVRCLLSYPNVGNLFNRQWGLLICFQDVRVYQGAVGCVG